MKIKIISLVVLFLIIGALNTGAARAQDGGQQPVTDNDVNRVAKQLYCPVCENIPLDVCPTQACADWRADIRDKLALGWSDEQIKQYFVDRYGQRVLATPPASGLNWLVYVIPPVAILAGALILYKALRTWKKPLPTISPPGPEATAPRDEYVTRLEEELRQR